VRFPDDLPYTIGQIPAIETIGVSPA
jgi:hypothetical protein